MTLPNKLLKIFGYKTRGDQILEVEKTRADLDICVLLGKIREQGATDEDIKTWWDMPNEQWVELETEDNIHKVATFKALIDEGISKEEAVSKIKKTFPVYELYKPELLYTGEDAPLPYELKPRINNYFNKLAQQELLKTRAKSEKLSSMNAYIRQLIKRGVI